jgi:ArsR family transcriptional regulator
MNLTRQDESERRRKTRAAPITRTAAEEYARWFRSLADGTRILVLNTVATSTRPLTVGEIVDSVGKSQSTVSRHLQILAEEEYVFLEPAGTSTLVSINRSCMTALPAAAAHIMATPDETR